MPYANNHEVRIYYESEGTGKSCLLMAHGGRGSLNDWRKTGYTEAFKDQFQLIMFDARSHGKSDRPIQATLRLMALDAIAVLDAANVPKATYWGYSMGSAVGLELAVNHASRFSSFILGGISPYEWPDEMVKPLQTALDYFQIENLTDKNKADIAILSALINRQPLTNDQLSGINAPCLFYCGAKDPYHDGASQAITHIPNARFVSIPKSNHATIKALNVIPHVKQFLDGFVP